MNKSGTLQTSKPNSAPGVSTPPTPTPLSPPWELCIGSDAQAAWAGTHHTFLEVDFQIHILKHIYLLDTP